MRVRTCEVSFRLVDFRTSQGRCPVSHQTCGTESSEEKFGLVSVNACCGTNHWQTPWINPANVFLLVGPSRLRVPLTWAALVLAPTSQLMGQRGSACFQGSPFPCWAVAVVSKADRGVWHQQARTT